MGKSIREIVCDHDLKILSFHVMVAHGTCDVLLFEVFFRRLRAEKPWGQVPIPLFSFE